MTAQPPIEAFLPTKVYTAETAADVETLKNLIEKIDLSSAIIVYGSLVEKNIEIPEDVKQSLLELTSFFNEVGSPEKDNYEEFDYMKWLANKAKTPTASNWRKGGFADRLFESIEPKTAAAFNTMIRGLAKFNQPNEAVKFAELALAENKPLDTTTYNAIIRCLVKTEFDHAVRWKSVTDWLQHMHDNQIKPDVQTMNSVLFTLSQSRYRKQEGLNVLAEFRALNIEPNLASWHHILRIFCKDSEDPSHVLVDILNHLGEKELDYTCGEDTQFFATAMSICANHLCDFDLANRLDRLRKLGSNDHLLGVSVNQRYYYRSYLRLALNTVPWPEFIEIFDDIIPNASGLDINLCEEIIGKINETGAIEFIPKFWSDMKLADLVQTHNNNSLEIIFGILCENQPQSDMPAHATLNECFSDCAWDYWDRVKHEWTNPGNATSTKRDKKPVPARSIGHLLLLVSRNNDYDRATEIFDDLKKKIEENKVAGMVSSESLKAFVNVLAKHNDSATAIVVLEFAIRRYVQDAAQLGELIVNNFTLNDHAKRKITDLIGRPVHSKV